MLAALAAFAVAPLRWVIVVALLVLVAADLHVWIFQAAAAQPGRHAYEGLSAPGRLLELPVCTRRRSAGSIYLWYDQVAGASGRVDTRRSRRSRPPGLSLRLPS